jgi:hypothetical protein
VGPVWRALANLPPGCAQTYTQGMALILSIDDFRLQARRRIPRAIFDYADGAPTMNAPFGATLPISMQWLFGSA